MRNGNEKRQKKELTASRFLIYSFSGLVVLSIVIFAFLWIFMGRESQRTVYEVGKIYMSGMNQQMAKHFETVIQLRFHQTGGIVSIVSDEGKSREQLYEELVLRAQIREFDYLALCSADGDFETLYGAPIQPLKSEFFVEAILEGEHRIAVGVDSAGKEVALFGVDASYPMRSGEESVGLIAAVPLEYITDFLSLEEEGQLMYYHIIRPDGSVVISDPNSELQEYFQKLQKFLDPAASHTDMEESLEVVGEALKDCRKFDVMLDLKGDVRQLSGIPLPNSEWFLVAVMPYGILDDTISSLSGNRILVILLSCAVVLILLTMIFFKHFVLTRAQIRELEEARLIASEASRAKSEFLANMSHDIRTPMNAIVGMTAIAAAHVDDREQVRNCLKKITLSSKHLLGLINDVLDMSKIESGKLMLTMERISLKEVVEGIVNIMQPQVEAKKQKFDIHVEKVLTENVWCDGVRLNQVLLNLLSNATKYTQEGGAIRLSLSEEKSPKGEGYIRIYLKVRDNGIGMSEEFQEKIFDSYSREDGARVHKTEGAGLGMAITKYIVDAMEGEITVRSELDRGTEFALTFDFEKVDTAEEDMRLPPWHMLVVDDDELLCRTVIDTLESIGVRAEWMLSGEKAIDRIIGEHREGDDYQIILLDWKLPGMNGIQVAKEIRRSLGEEVPILLISAYDWSEFEAEARTAGVTGFISKPLFKSTLFHALRQYMGEEAPETQPPDQEADLAGRRLLLAEDNEMNWEVARELLSALGMELDWAEDGQICLEKFRQSPEGYYDAVLMDLRMPRMNGYEAAAAIRKLKRSDAQSVPIIAMSADAFSEDIQRCLEYGMDAHLAKPIDLVEWTRVLQRYL